MPWISRRKNIFAWILPAKKMIRPQMCIFLRDLFQIKPRRRPAIQLAPDSPHAHSSLILFIFENFAIWKKGLCRMSCATSWLPAFVAADRFFTPCTKCSLHHSAREATLNYWDMEGQQELCSVCLSDSPRENVIQVWWQTPTICIWNPPSSLALLF